MTAELKIHNPPNARYSVLLLHGLGASGNDLFPLSHEIADGSFRVCCPDAPLRPVTINNGFEMRAWYDIMGMDLCDRQDKEGIAETTMIIEKYIELEKEKGFSSQQIILAGFSQGAAIALHVGLRHAEPLAGIICLSGYLLFADDLEKISAKNHHPPIFQAHGLFDPVVLPTWAQMSRDLLLENNYALTYKEYAMAHSISQETIKDLNQWLTKEML